MPKICPFRIAFVNDKCAEEGCMWYVSSTKMCAVKDIAHTLKEKGKK